ncbi:MAG: DUF2845 domain-containing protein [Nitrospiraceae bacterium]|nr:MAG: DUF2845 domain-containing protein [Nitrospiraceae bacterium]
MGQKVLLFFACLTISGLITAVDAYGLRCGDNLVDVGDRKIDVLAKCGEPVVIDEWYEEESFRRSSVSIHVEEWTYNFGPTRFIYFLKFKNGQLVEIRTGDHGY